MRRLLMYYGPTKQFFPRACLIANYERYMGVIHKRVDTRNTTRLDVESPGTFGITRPFAEEIEARIGGDFD